ncbi:hypothetical protein [Streptomyces sp. AJS327]|uniref:Rv1733c family protein n=1 Tax=Streptomyces sp. AJS327 TaxID=2545265 RepID=UPI001C60CB7F|nr:hypothetical protein [Streptomyces sp. AJS327]
MRVITGLWRWRGNPLCRASDRHEAWLTCCAVLLVVVAAPLAGWFGAGQVRSALLADMREQRLERRVVAAVAEQVTQESPAKPEDPRDAESDYGSPDGQKPRLRVTASWPVPDGTRRSGTVTLHHVVHPGERFRMWTDSRGRPVGRPMEERSATSHAALAGVAITAAMVATVEAGRRLAVRNLLRGRYARWEAEWRRIGPDWGRTGSSN